MYIYNMGKNRKGKDKKPKNKMSIRSKEERKEQIVTIMNKLQELKLTPHYGPIKQLYTKFATYINEGINIEIDIPFKMVSRHIKGYLSIYHKDEVWVNLVHID